MSARIPQLLIGTTSSSCDLIEFIGVFLILILERDDDVKGKLNKFVRTLRHGLAIFYV